MRRANAAALRHELRLRTSALSGAACCAALFEMARRKPPDPRLVHRGLTAIEFREGCFDALPAAAAVVKFAVCLKRPGKLV